MSLFDGRLAEEDEPPDDPLAYVGRGASSGEWYTPAYLVAAVRQALGTIDLDPASCAFAQLTGQATLWYHLGMNGLYQPWRGIVFLNPPYCHDLVEPFVGKLLDDLATGAVPAAILLTNNATETTWFQRAALACQAVCFHTHRVKFTTQRGPGQTPTQGQAILYFGPDVPRFHAAFHDLGIFAQFAPSSTPDLPLLTHA
jgi:ParB family chromosome partitioning protein